MEFNKTMPFLKENIILKSKKIFEQISHKISNLTVISSIFKYFEILNEKLKLNFQITITVKLSQK